MGSLERVASETRRVPVRAPPARTWLLAATLCFAGLFALFSAPPAPPADGSRIASAYLPLSIIEWMLLAYVHLADPSLLRSLRGRRRLLRDLGAGVGFALLVQLLAPLFPSSAALAPRTPAERAAFIAVALSAALSEELVFRGYLQEQLGLLLGRETPALVLQALLFGLVHAQQGARGAAMMFLAGLAFGALARATRSIRAGLFAHALIDLLAGFLR